jgi:protocatechuate 3,4-dioxygenase beta subunit
LLALATGALVLWRLVEGAGESRSMGRGAEPESTAGTAAAAQRPARSADAPGALAERDGERIAVAGLSAAAGAPGAAEEATFDERALYGTVLDVQGLPVPGARVALFRERAWREGMVALELGIADAEGRFRFRELEAYASYGVFAGASGFEGVLEEHGTGVETTLRLGRAEAIAGRVTRSGSGAPLPGIEVSIPGFSIDAEGGLARRQVALTDAEGNYHAGDARAGHLAIEARAPDGLPLSFSFQVRPERAARYDLALEGDTAFLVRVFELESGKPLAGAELQLAEGRRVTTDAEGLAEVRAPAPRQVSSGRLTLMARVPGYCRTTRTFGLPVEAPVDLPLVRGVSVGGRVTTPDGKPLANAEVLVQTRTGGVTAPNLPAGANIQVGRLETRTDAEGRYRVGELLPGHTMWVRAWHPDGALKRSDPLVLQSPGTHQEVDFQLGPTATLFGSVSRGGRPLAAKLAWSAEAATQGPTPSGVGRSNESGSYRLSGVVPGRVTIRVEADGAGESGSVKTTLHLETVTLLAGQELRYDFAVPAAETQIRGVVRTADGSPAAGVLIRASRAVNKGDYLWIVSAHSDREGRFELEAEGNPNHRYSLQAGEWPRQALAGDVAPGSTNVELVLAEAGELVLAIVDAASGAPLEQFSAYWRPHGSAGEFEAIGGRGGHGAPDPSGLFAAELPLGPVDVRVGARSRGYALAEVQNLLVAPAGQLGHERVAVERGVTLELVFPSEPGKRGPEVFLTTEAQRRELEAEKLTQFWFQEVHAPQRGRPNADGLLVLKGMAPGTYAFTDLPRGLALEPASMTIPPVDVHRVEVRWRSVDPAAEIPSTLKALEGLGYGRR